MRSAWILTVGLLLPGCSSGSEPGVLTVYAASSLKAPFTELGAMYERQHPGTAVSFNFAGSADLVAQVQQGAPSDVLATADQATMEAAQQSLPLSASAFASNTMRIVVPAGNPGNVESLVDLSDPGLTVVICAPQVPCGAATARVERASGIDIAADSEESAVSDVLGKVSSGQADAGIVYASDLATAGESVQGIDIPADVNTKNLYLIATLQEGGQPFTDLVLSQVGQQVLAADGFGAP